MHTLDLEFVRDLLNVMIEFDGVTSRVRRSSKNQFMKCAINFDSALFYGRKRRSIMKRRLIKLYSPLLSALLYSG